MGWWVLSIQPKLSKIWKQWQNGTEISQNSQKCWISEMQTIQIKTVTIEIQEATLNEKYFWEKVSENLGIPHKVVLFLEVLENAVPCTRLPKFKPDFLVEWKAPHVSMFSWLMRMMIKFMIMIMTTTRPLIILSQHVNAKLVTIWSFVQLCNSSFTPKLKHV